MTGDLNNLRKEFLKSGIIRDDLDSNPINQFFSMVFLKQWRQILLSLAQ